MSERSLISTVLSSSEQDIVTPLAVRSSAVRRKYFFRFSVKCKVPDSFFPISTNSSNSFFSHGIPTNTLRDWRRFTENPRSAFSDWKKVLLVLFVLFRTQLQKAVKILPQRFCQSFSYRIVSFSMSSLIQQSVAKLQCTHGSSRSNC